MQKVLGSADICGPLYCGRKLDNPERTHAGTGRTGKCHAQRHMKLYNNQDTQQKQKQIQYLTKVS